MQRAHWVCTGIYRNGLCVGLWRFKLGDDILTCVFPLCFTTELSWWHGLFTDHQKHYQLLTWLFWANTTKTYVLALPRVSAFVSHTCWGMWNCCDIAVRALSVRDCLSLELCLVLSVWNNRLPWYSVYQNLLCFKTTPTNSAGSILQAKCHLTATPTSASTPRSW